MTDHLLMLRDAFACQHVDVDNELNDPIRFPNGCYPDLQMGILHLAMSADITPSALLNVEQLPQAGHQATPMTEIPLVVAAEAPWLQCPQCTFLNEDTEVCCEMCFYPFDVVKEATAPSKPMSQSANVCLSLKSILRAATTAVSAVPDATVAVDSTTLLFSARTVAATLSNSVLVPFLEMQLKRYCYLSLIFF